MPHGTCLFGSSLLAHQRVNGSIQTTETGNLEYRRWRERARPLKPSQRIVMPPPPSFPPPPVFDQRGCRSQSPDKDGPLLGPSPPGLADAAALVKILVWHEMGSRTRGTRHATQVRRRGEIGPGRDRASPTQGPLPIGRPPHACDSAGPACPSRRWEPTSRQWINRSGCREAGATRVTVLRDTQNLTSCQRLAPQC